MSEGQKNLSEFLNSTETKEKIFSCIQDEINKSHISGLRDKEFQKTVALEITEKVITACQEAGTIANLAEEIRNQIFNYSPNANKDKDKDKRDSIPTGIRENILGAFEIDPMLNEKDSIELRKKGLTNLLESLKNPELWEPLYPDQITKVEKLVACQNALDTTALKTIVADIAPTGYGKTWLQALLSKRLFEDSNIPTLLVSRSRLILRKTKERFIKLGFEESDIGLVHTGIREIDRPIVMATFNQLKSKSFLKECFNPDNKYIPFNIVLDEGDEFQTDLSLKALEIIRNTLGGSPLVSGFSASTRVGNKEWSDVAVISDVMTPTELIRLGRAKHVLGFYVDLGLTLNHEYLSYDEYGRKMLPYEKLPVDIQKKLINRVVEIYQKHTPNEQSLYMVNSKRYCEDLKKALISAGYSADYMTQDKSKEYEEIWDEGYTQGEIENLIGIYVLGRGLDDDGVTRNIHILEMTESITRLLQFVGRALRKHPDIPFARIFQYIPKLESTFNLALIEHVFPDCIIPKNTKEAQRFKDLGRAEEGLQKELEDPNFTGMIGLELEAVSQEEPKDNELDEPPLKENVEQSSNKTISFLSSSRVRKRIDTAAMLRKERIIAEYFSEIMEGFLQLDGVCLENISTNHPVPPNNVVSFTKESKDVEFYWLSFIRIAFRVMVHDLEVNTKGVTDKVMIRLIKIWYHTGTKPSAELIEELIHNKSVYKKKIVIQNFNTIVDLFIKKTSGRSIESLSAHSPAPNTIINFVTLHGEPLQLRYDSFLRKYLSSIIGISLENAKNRLAFASRLIKMHFNKGVAVSKSEATKLLQEYENNELEIYQKLESIIKTDFKGVMNAFLQEAKIDSINTIKTNNPDATFKILYEGLSIRWRIFYESCFVLFSGKERSKANTYGKEIIQYLKKWYQDNKQPEKNYFEDLIKEKKRKAEILKMEPEEKIKLIKQTLSKHGLSEYNDFLNINVTDFAATTFDEVGTGHSVYRILTGKPGKPMSRDKIMEISRILKKT